MTDWKSDFAWQRQFIPAMKHILAEHLIGEAPHEEDALRNTDLIVLKLEPVRVACRVRHFEYVLKYPDQFTIRTQRPARGNAPPAQTELSKLIAGWGDYFLYGFAADGAPGALCAWMLGDLKVFRLWFMQQLALRKGKAPGFERKNGDQSSVFRAFSLKDLPKEFIVGRRRFASDELTLPMPWAQGEN